MLRRVTLLAVMAILVMGVAVAGDMPWFDMENCAMCQNISNRAELMSHVAWEQHNINGGIVSVTTVDMDYVPAYRKAHEAMTETGEKLMAGEKMQLCGSCTALGACLMKGVDQQYVMTSHGDVWILTSSNPEVTDALQAWGKRNKEEMAKAQKS